jgi:hypothetical protein
MKKTLLFAFSLFCVGASAQEHFSGINTSRRVGILNGAVNPAEFANLKNDHEINIFTFSANAANNKITLGDIIDGDNVEELIFSGDDPANLRADIDIMGPAFAMKRGKWGFGITTSAKVKASFVDIDVNLGDALTNSAADALLGSDPVPIDAQYNQKATATAWGELGFSVGRELYSSEEHRFTGGATVKLLFPGTYANIALDRMTGEIVRTGTEVNLTNAFANANISYSGSLAGDFTEVSNYTEFFAGGLNGFAADLGVSYQWKDTETGNNILNAGFAVRNLGSMTFKDDNNVSTNYRLDTGSGELNLNQFEDVENLTDIQLILQESPYFTETEMEKDFKVKLPTVFSAYADVQVYNKWFVSAYTQQKLNEDSGNDQLTEQNILTVTPRYSTDFFEAYVPLSHAEISGFSAGLGFRIGGFFIGSGSAITALLGEVDQADAYFGFRFGF